MALTAAYVADKSALARMDRPPVADRLQPLIATGKVATCTIVDLEVLFSATSPEEYEAALADRRQAYPSIDVSQATLDRALEVQSMLARRSAHRGASIPDLLIAATAELAGLTVLHYDADFDLIAEVTGQPVEWVVPAGSID